MERIFIVQNTSSNSIFEKLSPIYSRIFIEKQTAWLNKIKAEDDMNLHYESRYA